MKKSNILLFISIFVISFFLLNAISYAGLASNRFSIGGIKLGYNLSQVKKSLGEPKKIDTEMKNSVHDGSKYELKTVYYGTSFKIYIMNGHVISIISSGKNGIKTRDGIKVGDPEIRLADVYGQPNQSVSDNGIQMYIYDDDTSNQFVFQIKNGKISEIVLTTSY